MTGKKRILVVDDMGQIRGILRFNLQKQGFEVLEAHNGEKALEHVLGGNPPDLIVLDIMMPRMDGYEVLRRIRRSSVGENVPVIFLTAKAQKTDVLKGMEAGGNDYVVKPFKFESLHGKIQKLIGAHPDRELSAIMVTDIEGFSKEMEHDEEQTYSKLLKHNEIIRRNISQYRGNEIKTIGDAFMIRFKSTFDAVKAAISIQKDFLGYNRDKKSKDQILVRIGIHIGDIMIVGKDVFGNGVNVASRIEPFAQAGGICISEDAFNVVKKSMNIKVSSLGKKQLKNISEPVKIYKVEA